MASLLYDSTRSFQLFAALRQATALAISIVLVKGALPQEQIGQYEEWFWLGAILSFLVVTGVGQAFNLLYPSVGRSLIASAYLVLILVLSFLAMSIWLARDQLIPFLTGQDELLRLDLVLLFLILHLSASLLPHVLLVEKKPLLLFRFGIFYLLSMLAAVGLPLIQQKGLEGILSGLLVFGLAEHALLLLLVFKSSVKQIWSGASKVFRKALPLSVYSFLGALGLLFDGWLVNFHFQDLSTFAVFRYGARELPGTVAVAAAFGTAMLPLLGAEPVKSLARLKVGSLRLMHLFLPAAIVLTLCSPWLFDFVYDASYVASARLFNVYLLILVSRCIFAHTILMSRDGDSALIWVSIFELLLNVSLSLLLVASWGLVGIAAATAIAYTFEKIMLMWIVKSRYAISPRSYLSLSWLGCYTFGLVLAFMIAEITLFPHYGF